MVCEIIIYSTYPTEIQGTRGGGFFTRVVYCSRMSCHKLRRMWRTISREPLCLFIWKTLPAVSESFFLISRTLTRGTAGSLLEGDSSIWTSSLQWRCIQSASVSLPHSPSFLTLNYFLLEVPLGGLYNQNDFIRLWGKNPNFIPKSWVTNCLSLKKMLVHFGLYPSIFQKGSSFYAESTPHAGCNGNTGSLLFLRAPPFYFGEPLGERGSQSTCLGGATLQPDSWSRPQPGQSEIPGLAQRWSHDPKWAQSPWGVARLQEGCPDLLAAIFLPRGISLAGNEKKNKKNKAQKWEKDTIPGEVVESLGSNWTESQPHFFWPLESSEPNLFGMKPTWVGFCPLKLKDIVLNGTLFLSSSWENRSCVPASPHKQTYSGSHIHIFTFHIYIWKFIVFYI